jgi:glyoxylase-like metal-dependent hydrolase (beta-lactamase superfamily II)
MTCPARLRGLFVASFVLVFSGAAYSPRTAAPAATEEYTISAIRYGTIRNFRTAGLVMGADPAERLDIALVIWVMRGNGRVVLFDTGFHRERWFNAGFDVADFMRPDSALMTAGVDPSQVTDVIVSHAHWDHMGGLDLFPDARVHIQREEFEYYTGAAWEEGGRHGGIDEEDMVALFRRHMAGQVVLLPGDDVEVLPGIRAFTGARHTWASQYVRVDGARPVVLASDNCYLFRNLETMTAGATFLPSDRAGNEAALARMEALAGAASRVIPGHDALQFQRFPTEGRVAYIRR